MCWMALSSLEQPRAKAERGATKIVSQEKTQQTPASSDAGPMLFRLPWDATSPLLAVFHGHDKQFPAFCCSCFSKGSPWTSIWQQNQ